MIGEQSQTVEYFTPNYESDKIHTSFVSNEPSEFQKPTSDRKTMKHHIKSSEFEKLLLEVLPSKKDELRSSKEESVKFLIHKDVVDSLDNIFQFSEEHVEFFFKHTEPFHFANVITESIDSLAQRFKVVKKSSDMSEEWSIKTSSSLPNNFALVTGFVVKSGTPIEPTRFGTPPTKENFESRHKDIIDESKCAFMNDLPKFFKEICIQKSHRNILI